MRLSEAKPICTWYHRPRKTVNVPPRSGGLMGRIMLLMKHASLAIATALTVFAIDDTKLVDLTHTFDEKTVYWPTAKPFVWHKEAWGPSQGGYWYASGSFEASEHLGTHIDSPIHFAEKHATTDALQIRQLIGPAVVIDISKAAAASADYQLSVSDVATWEKSHGPIPAGAIVVVRTNWSKFWPDRARYMGTAKAGDVKNLHFPGISAEAAKQLVSRRI